jgi:hypothetical protein
LYGFSSDKNNQLRKWLTMSSPQIVQTTTLERPIGLLFLGRKDMSLSYKITSGLILSDISGASLMISVQR